MQITVKVATQKTTKTGKPYWNIWAEDGENYNVWDGKLFAKASALKPGDVADVEFTQNGNFKNVTSFNSHSGGSGVSASAGPSSNPNDRELGIYTKYALNAWTSGKSDALHQAVKDVLSLRAIMRKQLELDAKPGLGSASQSDDVKLSHIATLLSKMEKPIDPICNEWKQYMDSAMNYYKNNGKALASAISELEAVLAGESQLTFTPDGSIAFVGN